MLRCSPCRLHQDFSFVCVPDDRAHGYATEAEGLTEAGHGTTDIALKDSCCR